MAYEWKELALEDQPRNPLADFALNVMARFTAAEIGLSNEHRPMDRSSDFDQQWWLALVSVTPGLSIAGLMERAADFLPPDHPGSLVIPGEYSEDFRNRQDIDVITLYARRDYLNAANAANGAEQLGIETLLVSTPLESQTLSSPAEPFTPPDLKVPVTPNTVVTAVIDHGVAIAHDLFRRKDINGDLVLSRVDFFLDMDGTPDPNAPVPSTIGRVWTGPEINEILKNNLHNGLLDDAAVYRDLGLIDWKTRPFNACAHRLSHGTHVTGLASGYDASDADGLERRIIVVQLPTRLVANTLGFGLEQAIEQAMSFISQQLVHFQVDEVEQQMPLVVNFSFGNFMGPHDGTGEVSRSIDTIMSNMEASSNRPRLLMMPSGNGNLSRCHAVINLTQAAPTAELDWQLQPADRSASILSVWLPVMTPVKDNTVTMQVTVPGFDTPRTLTAGMTPSYNWLTEQDHLGNTIILGLVVYQPPVAPTARGKFTIAVVPTDNPMRVGLVAPSGDWKLQFVKGNAVDKLSLNIWVQRDETLPDFPEFGRQSYLSDPSYTRFNVPGGKVISEDPVAHASPVRRAGMINGIACGNLPAVIAGYVSSDGRMSAYSAGGPTLNGFRLTGPDASAVSDDSVVLHGVLSAGSNCGSRVSMSGTSVSTPRVARWVADQFAQSPTTPFGRGNVVAKALNDDPPSPHKPSAFRTGGGRMELRNIFGSLRWPGQ
ncbi:S8 family serine peptidase [Ruegeria litorea]|uniref:S8 family serine peptidase n=1 Tax=Falsiruegeria litorea TaxID=1280831 RepID=A0ABS5WVM2_9RHOB|nr:S8 family serine peptidase [Falsiruegeria litorea]MBT3143184.1 S8 family serine peptidase [Falsiruegeria litorea]